ncbi:MAG: YlmC/YmxH family sporulation protein [Desulfotomaculaceae bacterium]|nr:YlmC/YmxH family sporulation protein [Desulfotomaculaceae bacterium]
MRMGELVGKEIININNGRRLGVVGDSDMNVDIESGDIQSIILPRRNNLINLWVDRQHLIIPWASIKKIGTEVIIVELDQTNPLYQRFPM